ncbi:shrunken seed protein (SSE1) [Wolffia australiana]
METYRKWVRQNREFVQSLESMANGLTWLLPERFSNSEIGPEAVYAFLGVFSTVNQHIIDSTPTQGRSRGTDQSSSPWPLCISMLKDLETVVEVAAQHFLGEDGKWNFIAVTEATKVLVRLAQFKNSGYKILLQGGETPNIQKTSKISGGHDQRNLEGRALSALDMFAQNAKMSSERLWVSRAASSSHASSTSLSQLWSEKGISGGLLVMGEVLCVIRPLVYVLYIRKYGIKSWTPWLVSLAVDLTGVGILSYITRPAVADQERRPFPLSVPEENELKRRKILWALYIMRDPFFSNYVRRRLESGEKYMHQVPLVGFLTAKIVELLIGAQTRYTYISGA